MDTGFGGLQTGDVLDPLVLNISAAANERYWQAAGINHPLLRAGALYPLIAANLIVLALTHHYPEAMIQTRQHLKCHRRAEAPSEVVTMARVTERYEKRGLEYIVIEAIMTVAGVALWDGQSHFTPAASATAR